MVPSGNEGVNVAVWLDNVLSKGSCYLDLKPTLLKSLFIYDTNAK